MAARLIAGSPALDFANTVEARLPRPGEHPPDYLDGYPELVRWSRWAGVIDAPAEERLLAAAPKRPAAARAALRSARALRETVYRVFAALAGGKPVERDDLDSLRDWYAKAMRRAVLATERGRVTLTWRHREELDAMLWPLAASAVELAAGEKLARLKQCPGHDGRCGWLFLDTTKNASRRWCSMQDCGNPNKARRQNERRRAARRAGAPPSAL